MNFSKRNIILTLLAYIITRISVIENAEYNNFIVSILFVAPLALLLASSKLFLVSGTLNIKHFNKLLIFDYILKIIIYLLIYNIHKINIIIIFLLIIISVIILLIIDYKYEKNSNRSVLFEKEIIEFLRKDELVLIIGKYGIFSTMGFAFSVMGVFYLKETLFENNFNFIMIFIGIYFMKKSFYFMEKALGNILTKKSIILYKIFILITYSLAIIITYIFKDYSKGITTMILLLPISLKFRREIIKKYLVLG